MKKWLCYIIFSWCALPLFAQADSAKRMLSRNEFLVLKKENDTILLQLKYLYKKEIKEGIANKYHVDRVNLVRQYLQLFQHIATTSPVIAYKQKDIVALFGAPDSVARLKPNITVYYFGDITKQYVRIANLRYRFYFENKVLGWVERE